MYIVIKFYLTTFNVNYTEFNTTIRAQDPIFYQFWIGGNSRSLKLLL